MHHKHFGCEVVAFLCRLKTFYKFHPYKLIMTVISQLKKTLFALCEFVSLFCPNTFINTSCIITAYCYLACTYIR